MNAFLDSNTLNIEGHFWYEKIDWIGLFVVLALSCLILLAYVWIPIIIAMPVSIGLLYFQRRINDTIKKNV